MDKERSLTEERVNVFTAKLVDEVLEARASDAGDLMDMSRRQLLRLLKPVAGRLQNLDGRLIKLVEKVEELEKLHEDNSPRTEGKPGLLRWLFGWPRS